MASGELNSHKTGLMSGVIGIHFNHGLTMSFFANFRLFLW